FVPPRGAVAAQCGRLAVRLRLLAALAGLRPRARLEPVRPALVPGRRRLHVRLAARARPAPWGRSRRRAGLRPRALPRDPEHRPPAGRDLRAAAARALRLRAREADEPLVAPALHRSARVDPALRPGTPGSGRDALLSRIRPRADPRPPPGG